MSVMNSKTTLSVEQTPKFSGINDSSPTKKIKRVKSHINSGGLLTNLKFQLRADNRSCPNSLKFHQKVFNNVSVYGSYQRQNAVHS